MSIVQVHLFDFWDMELIQMIWKHLTFEIKMYEFCKI